MDDAVVVKVCDSGKGGPNKIGCIRLVVVAFAANAVEKFTTKGKISYQVY
jgi:hypothetical protein